MRLWPEQLASALSKGLAPLYLVAGDETLLVEEAGDLIRAAARAQGFDEREVLTVDKGFDWPAVMAAAGSLSLFASRRLLELRLSAKVTADTGKRLAELAERSGDDDRFLVFAPKLESRAMQTAWYKALDAKAVVVPIRPVEGGQLPDWVYRRMRSRGLEPEPQALTLFTERVEGNLLACAQEIEKLLMLYGPGPLSAEQVLEAVADSPRYDTFALVDAALAGSVRRTVRILHDLRAEGVEPVLVLWALTREARGLAQMARALRDGQSIGQVLSRQRVWEKRKGMVGNALQRLSLGRCRGLLQRAARIDRVIKGVEPGEPWDELMDLSLRLAGVVVAPER